MKHHEKLQQQFRSEGKWQFSRNQRRKHKNLQPNDRKFKIAVIKKLNELQENSKRQFNELWNKINEQKEYFTKEIESLKENQTEILEMNTINGMKNNVESITKKADNMEERLVSSMIET